MANEALAMAESLRTFEGSDALGNGDFSALHKAADLLDRLARIEQVDGSELLQRLLKAAELTNGLEVGRDCEEYSFARSPDFQAMTYNEDAFRALKALPEAADTIRAQRARISELEAERKIRLVTLGAGQVVVNWGTYEGTPAVFLEPLPDGKAGEEGALVPDHLQGPKDSLPHGSIVLALGGEPTTFIEYIRAALRGDDHG